MSGQIRTSVLDIYSDIPNINYRGSYRNGLTKQIWSLWLFFSMVTHGGAKQKPMCKSCDTTLRVLRICNYRRLINRWYMQCPVVKINSQRHIVSEMIHRMYFLRLLRHKFSAKFCFFDKYLHFFKVLILCCIIRLKVPQENNGISICCTFSFCYGGILRRSRENLWIWWRHRSSRSRG